MPNLQNLGQQLAQILKKQNADYIEAHFEDSQYSSISYRGRQLESVSKTISIGGNVRALVKGGWGFVSFNDLNNLQDKVELAVKQASFVGKEVSQFAESKPVVENVVAKIAENPMLIPLSEKKLLLDEYNDAIWSTSGIQTSNLGYGDSHRKTLFLNSRGSFITQERTDVTLRAVAVAAKNGEVQQAGLSEGSRDDFSPIRKLHKDIKELAQRAVDMLTVPTIPGGQYTVVLDPILAGVFVHEAFGHLSESDFVYENEQLKEIMTLGKVFGGPHLNIIDSAVRPGLRGSFKYDDEGTPATKTYLIREGKLAGRLHSRETAAKMKEQPTGNARAINYRHPPIVRMTNTYIEPQDCSFADMIADIKEGVYAKNWYGGQTSMEMFTFSAGETYMIRNGKIAEMVRPVMLSGNVFNTLMNIDAIGNDLDMNQGGGCGKGGQSPLPVSNGSPHIRIRQCLVGGK
ncbi:MAG: TldD/PmbA family protein [Dehalococcoidales bacterium]|nr:TldD/PmbA family protein [Dehalococcoidales bacterium]